MNLSIRARIAIVVVTLGILAFGFQNCGATKFESRSGSTFSGGKGECSNVTKETTQQLKIIYMVDNSQSAWNVDHKIVNGNRFKPLRSAAVRDFLSAFGDKPNFRYIFSAFSTEIQTFDFSSLQFKDTALNVTGAAEGMAVAADQFDGIASPNGTAYIAAFTHIKNLILADNVNPDSNPWRYSIVFVSDGEPMDMASSLEEKKTQIKTQIQTAKDAAKQMGSVAAVSTVYLGPPNPNSDKLELLKFMAAEGGGVFVDTRNDKNETIPINLAEAIIVPGNSCD